MTFIDGNSDDAMLEELGRRIARYRLNQNKTQDALAQESGVSKQTIHRIEKGHSTQTLSLIRVFRALGLLENFETLIPEPAISPLQQVKMHGKTRQRASSQADSSERKTPWSWGVEE